MGEHFRILSIDGGGTRGIAPIAYLNYIQKELKGDAIHEFFDLIVGTSTGGIIALGLAMGLSTENILDFYKTRAKEIFKPSLVPRKIKFFLMPITKPVYKHKDLIRNLKSTFGEMTCLRESKTRICIPAINITTGKNVVFKTRHHKDYINDHKRKIWEIASATCAAPFYFSPPKYDHGAYVDGGLWANNPSIVGIAEAIKLKVDLANIQILSIGTGSKLFYQNTSKAKTNLFWQCGLRLFHLVLGSQSWGTDNISQYLCGANYKRIDFELAGSFDDRLDCLDYSQLESIAIEKAKTTCLEVKKEFFSSKVKPFTPIP